MKLDKKSIKTRTFGLNMKRLTLGKLVKSKGVLVVDKYVNLVITQYKPLNPDECKTLHKEFSSKQTYGF